MGPDLVEELGVASWNQVGDSMLTMVRSRLERQAEPQAQSMSWTQKSYRRNQLRR